MTLIPLFDEPTPAADLQNTLNILINEINALLNVVNASTPLFSSRTLASLSEIPIAIQTFQTAGYAIKGDGGGALYIRAVGSTPGGFQSFDGAWWQLAEQLYNVQMFGAVGDGVADDTAAFQAAIAIGKPVVVSGSSSVYKITATLALGADQSISGDGSYPTIKLVHATLGYFFTMAARSSIRGLTLDGSASGATSSQAILTAQGCVIDDNRFLDDKATVATITVTANSVKVTNNYSLRANASGVFLFGSGAFNNSVIGNTWEFADATQGLFGCDVFGGAHDNLISFNTKIKGLAEVVGVRYNSYGNRIIGNFIRDNGDNGISITGYNNVVVGNRCLNVSYGGIVCYGNGNTVTGNTVLNAGQVGSADSGIVCDVGFGGTGQFNVITGNFVDDDQSAQTMSHGVYIRATAYTIWAAGQTISAIGTFRTYGLNLYSSTNTGLTGATPPTNTSGAQSDGTVIWQYINRFVGACESRYNKVSGNTVRRAIFFVYNDAVTNWVYNFINDYQSGADGTTRPSYGGPTAAVPYTIASGVITLTKADWTSVDTEGGAASDDLTDINGGQAGWVITVSTVNAAHDVTLKDNTGNLRLAGDCVLGGTADRITLQYAGTFWAEISRSIN